MQNAYQWEKYDIFYATLCAVRRRMDALNETQVLLLVLLASSLLTLNCALLFGRRIYRYKILQKVTRTRTTTTTTFKLLDCDVRSEKSFPPNILI